MSRKKFSNISGNRTLLITVTVILESVFNNKLWNIAGIIIMIFIFLHISYLLIVKKSIKSFSWNDRGRSNRNKKRPR